MSNFHSCDRCDNLVWTGKEQCRCKAFTYQVKEWGHEDSDWTTMYCRGDADDAAREIVSNDYWSDPGNPSDVDFTVTFRDERGNTISYQVTAEATVDFNVKEVPEAHAPGVLHK